MARGRYLIIHADDAGMSHSVNRATIEAMERGAVTSASLMVPCAWFPEIARYAAEHPEKDFGVHLTLTSEWRNYRWGPVAPRERVASLVDADGYLWRTTKLVVEHVKANEAEIEWRAQIERACRYGVRISHIDSHMDVGVCRPDLAEVYADLAAEYHLPALFVRPESDPPAGYARAARLAEARHLAMLDSLHPFYFRGSHESRKTLYLDTLRTLEPGVSQIIVHCGYDDDELRAITPSISIRDSDRRIFTDPEVSTAIQDYGIETITWRQFLALPRPDREVPHGA
jgi:predicted glycoside hydrolase/deacetylase ChbG (UPF0249 family)